MCDLNDQSNSMYVKAQLPRDIRRAFVTQEILQNFACFKCLICSFTTMKNFEIEQHVFVHCRGKPFKCSLCNCTFLNRSAIFHHCAVSHPFTEMSHLLIHKDLLEKENYAMVLKDGSQINVDDIRRVLQPSIQQISTCDASVCDERDSDGLVDSVESSSTKLNSTDNDMTKKVTSDHHLFNDQSKVETKNEKFDSYGDSYGPYTYKKYSGEAGRIRMQVCGDQGLGSNQLRNYESHSDGAYIDEVLSDEAFSDEPQSDMLRSYIPQSDCSSSDEMNGDKAHSDGGCSYSTQKDKPSNSKTEGSESEEDHRRELQTRICNNDIVEKSTSEKNFAISTGHINRSESAITLSGTSNDRYGIINVENTANNKIIDENRYDEIENEQDASSVLMSSAARIKDDYGDMRTRVDQASSDACQDVSLLNETTESLVNRCSDSSLRNKDCKLNTLSHDTFANILSEDGGKMVAMLIPEDQVLHIMNTVTGAQLYNKGLPYEVHPSYCSKRKINSSSSWCISDVRTLVDPKASSSASSYAANKVTAKGQSRSRFDRLVQAQPTLVTSFKLHDSKKMKLVTDTTISPINYVSHKLDKSLSPTCPTQQTSRMQLVHGTESTMKSQEIVPGVAIPASELSLISAHSPKQRNPSPPPPLLSPVITDATMHRYYYSPIHTFDGTNSPHAISSAEQTRPPTLSHIDSFICNNTQNRTLISHSLVSHASQQPHLTKDNSNTDVSDSQVTVTTQPSLTTTKSYFPTTYKGFASIPAYYT